MKKLIAGNWKMNGSKMQAQQLVAELLAGDKGSAVDVCLCPPYPYISQVLSMSLPAHVSVGAQDCSCHGESGAFTGDVSAPMLKDLGCFYVILGHSERRQYQGDTNLLVMKKAELAHKAGLSTIICVGETENERMEGIQDAVVIEQLLESIPQTADGANLVIAYEPVWAIGTGKTATPEDVRAMHAVIRQFLDKKVANAPSVRILYGGSVKPENAAELLSIPHVDGALVGGASLKADQFLAIIAASV